MSLATNLVTAFTRVATEAKALRTLINGNVADLSSLTTTATSNLVAAINELDAAIGSAGATDLDGLSDVVIASPATGHLLRHNGTNFVNVLGTTHFEVAGAAAAAVVTSQAAIDALVAGAPGLLNTLDELAAALGDDANYAATITTALAGKQPLDTDLTAIAALTSAANKIAYATGAGTWALTDFTSAGRALVDDADAAAQRATLSVYSQAEIGDPATDFSAAFVAGLT